MAGSLKEGKVRRQVDFDLEDILWYEGAYGKGTLSSGISRLLKEFKKAHQFSPEELAAKGAAEVKRLILNDEFEPSRDEESSQSEPNPS